MSPVPNPVRRQRPIRALVLLAWVPFAVHAEAYKCRQPDGSTSFQDRPCASGAVGSPLVLPVPSAGPAPKSAPSGDSWQDKEHQFQKRREDEEVKAYNQDVQAGNRAQRCSRARNQLGILKEGRPVYRRDNNGERQYVKDEDRKAETAAASRKVAEECS